MTSVGLLVLQEVPSSQDVFPSEQEVTVTMLITSPYNDIELENILRESIENGDLLSSFVNAAEVNGYSKILDKVLVKIMEHIHFSSLTMLHPTECVDVGTVCNS